MSTIGLILVPENATKLITKNLKGRESSEDEAWHNPCSNLLEYTSIIYGGEQD